MRDYIIELISINEFGKLRAFLAEANHSDISECLDELSKEEVAVVFRLLSKDDAADVFVRMEADTQEKLIEILTDKEIADIIAEVFVDDAVDLISEMPAVLVNRILKNTDPSKRKHINELLKYPDDSAGSLMTIEYVDLKRDMTVKEAFDRIRKTGLKKDTIYTLYVKD